MTDAELLVGLFLFFLGFISGAFLTLWLKDD
jgi:hypothetical protein